MRHKALYLCTPTLNTLKSYGVSLILVLICGSLWAQTVPVLSCISLDTNDDITLYWKQPSDTGTNFNGYVIYGRTSSSLDFERQDSITDYNQTSALIPGSWAGDASFYIVQDYNSGDRSPASDTASPMLIGLSSTGKRVSIGWNHTGLTSQDSLYRVYKQDTAGNWNLFKTLEYPMTAARDSTYGCSESVRYRVETKGRDGCISRSNEVGKLVIDMEPPRPANLQCASVDTATGNVLLEWGASKSADTYGYLIFYFEDFIRSDTSFGNSILQSVYTKNGIDALIRPETLSIAPFDSCFDSVNMWYNQAPDSLRFVTMFIDTIGFEKCDGKLIIKWSHPGETLALGVRNLGGFNVYRESNGQPSELIANLGALDSIFVDSGLIAGTKYTYVVAAVDEITGKEALSNKLNIDLKGKNEPDYIYISSIKNNHETGLNEVHILADTLAETVEYGLLRSLAGDELFTEVDRIEADVSERFTIPDIAGKAGQAAYTYEIRAYDECGDIIGASQQATSIHLTGTKNIRDLINHLYWTEYEGFDSLGNGILGYDLYRSAGLDEVIGMNDVPVDHQDDLADLRDLQGKVCYYVYALEDGSNSYGRGDTSISNLHCFDYPAIAFVPNAFSPDGDGVNDVFLPFVNYVDQSDYLLRIYDRMGRLVFESSNPNEGWKGGTFPNGTYAYHLRLRNVHDELIEQAGKVHLIR